MPASFGLPNVFTPAGNSATGRVRLLSPGYAPTSTVPFERTGGLQVTAHVQIAALGIDDANFTFSLSPNGDFAAHASVAQLGFAGFSITNATVDVNKIGGALTVTLDGTANLLGSTTHVHGILNPDLTGNLTVDARNLTIGGFGLTNGTFALTRSATTTQLIVHASLNLLGTILTVDGTIVLDAAGTTGTLTVTGVPSSGLGFGSAQLKGTLRLTFDRNGARMTVNGSLDIPGIANGLAVTGNLDSNGNGDLTLTVTSLSIRGFSITNATFTAAKNGPNLSFGATGKLSFLGASLTVQQGTLTITPTTISGNLTLTGITTTGLDLGSAKLKGTLTIAFSASNANIAVNGTLDVPGIANGLAVTGNLDSNGNGNVTLTVTSLSIRGFSITNATFTAAKNGPNLSFGATGKLSFFGGHSPSNRGP